MSFHCSRIKHTIRINTPGDVSFCCALRDNPEFTSVEEMYASAWYKHMLDCETTGIWPKECYQCKEQEDHNQPSFRTASNRKHPIFSKINSNYKILDVSTDNICNAACQTCGSESSSYYGKIMGKKKLIVNDGEKLIDQYLNDDVVQIDLAGGEPLYSKSYRKILENLPKSVRWLRINTNGSVYYDFTDILQRGIVLELTVSLDGTEKVFEYTRWPLKWDIANQNFKNWVKLREQFPNKLKLAINFTVSALNIANIDEIRKYAAEHKSGLSYNFLNRVTVLDIRYSNRLTKRAINVKYDFPIAWDKDNDQDLETWLAFNDKVRNINYRDYLGD